MGSNVEEQNRHRMLKRAGLPRRPVGLRIGLGPDDHRLAAASRVDELLRTQGGGGGSASWRALYVAAVRCAWEHPYTRWVVVADGEACPASKAEDVLGLVRSARECAAVTVLRVGP